MSSKPIGRFVTGNYNFETGSMTGILEHLKWESLKKRRRDSRQTTEVQVDVKLASHTHIMTLWQR